MKWAADVGTPFLHCCSRPLLLPLLPHPDSALTSDNPAEFHDNSNLCAVFVLFFETGSYYIAWADLKLESWDYRRAPAHPASYWF
jgi:hypothetical protein